MNPDVRKKRDPFTYEGYTLDELIDLTPGRIRLAVTTPTAANAKDLCRLSREMWHRYFDEYSRDGARAYRARFFDAQVNLGAQVGAIRDSLADELRKEATNSLNSISERITDAQTLFTEGMGRFGDMLLNRVLALTAGTGSPAVR